MVARAHAIAGRDAEMVAALDEANATGAGDPDVAAAVLGCRALRSLLVEDRARAATDLAEAMALVRAHPTATQRPYFGLAAIVATLATPPGDAARAAVRAATATGVGVIEGLVDYADAVARGRTGDLAGAARAFLAAEARFAPSGDRFVGYHQLGRRLVAEAALADGWGDPAGWLTEAARFFQRRGQVHVELACRSLLRRSGARVPRRTYGHSTVSARLAELGVTDREAEVGALVGKGLTSRDVGRLLFISPRTVDKHVQRLMDKTRTASRSDLGPLFDG